MASPFVIAHISDLHLSTFGDTFHDSARIVKRGRYPIDERVAPHKPRWEQDGWRVLHPKAAIPGKVILVDPQGYRHPVPPQRQMPGLDATERAATKAIELEARRAQRLARDLPSDQDIARLLESSPINTNIRFLDALRAIDDGVDQVIITGDITDDGDGWELAESALDRRLGRGRLLAVPGNHDLYTFPFSGSGRPRPTHESKQAGWTAFAGREGIVLEACGAWVQSIPEARAVVVGLNSCAHKQRSLFRQNGGVGQEQLQWLRALASTSSWIKACHRIVAFHHHLVRLPHGVGKRAPTEFGMRLNDAKAVAALLNEIGVTLVLHGHRHISERRQPAGCNFELVAAPSLTLGCRSGDGPSFWRIELGDRVHFERVRIAQDAVKQDDAVPEVASRADHEHAGPASADHARAPRSRRPASAPSTRVP